MVDYIKRNLFDGEDIHFDVSSQLLIYFNILHGRDLSYDGKMVLHPRRDIYCGENILVPQNCFEYLHKKLSVDRTFRVH